MPKCPKSNINKTYLHNNEKQRSRSLRQRHMIIHDIWYFMMHITSIDAVFSEPNKKTLPFYPYSTAYPESIQTANSLNSKIQEHYGAMRKYF
jgi:hypothetical protein